MEHVAGGGHQPLLGFSPRMTLVLGLGKVFLLQGQLLQMLGTTASNGTSPPGAELKPHGLADPKASNTSYPIGNSPPGEGTVGHASTG